jgi:hypothetical protein
VANENGLCFYVSTASSSYILTLSLTTCPISVQHFLILYPFLFISSWRGNSPEWWLRTFSIAMKYEALSITTYGLSLFLLIIVFLFQILSRHYVKIPLNMKEYESIRKVKIIPNFIKVQRHKYRTAGIQHLILT